MIVSASHEYHVKAMNTARPPLAAGHFQSLDTLRGMAALAVFAAHFVQQFQQVHAMGWAGVAFELLGVIGVSVFFVLSGFLIHLGVLKERERQGSVDWRQYARRRFFRIYPAYFFALVVYSLVNPHLNSNMVSETSVAGFWSHLFLLSSFVPGEYQGINAIFWTVVVECHFYLIYPFLQKPLRQLHPLAFFAATWVAGTLFFLAASALTPAGSTRVMLQHTAPALFWKWALGALLAEACVRPGLNWLRRALSHTWLVMPVLILIYGGTFWNHAGIELNYKRFVLPFFCAALVGLFIFSDLSQWRTRIGRWLGDISYSVYLWHPLALALLATYPLGSLGLNLAASLTLTLLLSALSHRLLELPSIRLGKRRTTLVDAPAHLQPSDALPLAENSPRQVGTQRP
jgi:peptidoglycan/LPS O-acetylase OafA/YrhL